MDLESAGEQQSFLTKRSNLGLGLAAAALVAAFAVMLLLVPYKLFAEDSYFYFQVAWNFARGKGSTFNNIMPTNGYHPLWMLVCAAVFKVIPDKGRALVGIGGVIAVLQILTLLTVRRIVQKVAGDLWPITLVLLVPFCFTSQLGTEGALSGWMLALMMLLGYQLCVRPSLGLTALFSFISAIAVLSRLDNIFIESFVWCAVWLALGRESRARRWLLTMLPIYVVLWGGYIASNWIYFHTLQPISGMLKSKSKMDHGLGANLPHTALIAMAVIVVCLAIVSLKKRDLFYRAIEVPFALGVLCHAAYIVFIMSSETKWSWYYTSWILLASVLMARAGSILLAERRRLVVPVCVACLALLAASWWRVSYHQIYRSPDLRPSPELNETVYQQAGIHRVFAYDQPGMLAYYTDLQIVPLDGLMGDMKFQHDLATKGVEAVVAEDHIDGFVGPPVPLNNDKDLCLKVYLSSERFHCVPNGNGGWNVTGVEVYARVPRVLAGTLPLENGNIVWASPHYISVWRLTPPAK